MPADAETSSTRSPVEDLEQLLVDICAETYDDPLRFVELMYPWPIAGQPGPTQWQREALQRIGQSVRDRAFDGVHPVAPYRAAYSTGHGVGKTALYAMIVDWIMSTRPHCRGTVTANTNDQLRDKTWAAVREWTARCATRHWFTVNSEVMYRIGHRGTWFTVPLSCAPENADAYQGQHARDSTSFYILDEASGVDTRIWQAADGGLTDGEPLIICGGQMLRNSGSFYEAVFGRGRDLWHPVVIDARQTEFASNAIYQEWSDLYGGEDSDYYRVRVRGLAPMGDELQFIDQQRVRDAQVRQVAILPDDPLIAGVDVSGGGNAWTVCRFRQGLDARSRPPIRISGEQSRDRNYIVSTLAERLSDTSDPIAAMFIDAAFGAAVVERLRMLGFKQVQEVNFGAPSPDTACANMRASMWKQTKEWVSRGAIPRDDHRLAADLTGPGYHLNQSNKLVLESKASMQARGVASPDDGDGLALTFAQRVHVGARTTYTRPVPVPVSGPMAWGVVFLVGAFAQCLF